MSDENIPVETPPMTQEQIDAHNAQIFINRTKTTAYARLIATLDGVGGPVMNQYPTAEVKTWEYQKYEAERALALANPTVAELQAAAPTIFGVTVVHKGPAEDPDRIAQVIEKAQIVKANSDAFIGVGIFVNGLRARAQDRIDAATEVTEVYIIEGEIMEELRVFRETYGV